MIYAQPGLSDDPITIPRMPSWVTSRRAETPEDVAFLSGAALGHLHVVLGSEEVPKALLRDRLALRAAEACVAYSGRPERAGELRDEVHLLRPGDQPGPCGAIYQQWRRAAERPLSIKALHRALPTVAPEQIAAWLDRCDTGRGGPVSGSSIVLETVLNEVPRSETEALILADAALAQALGWSHAMPLLAAGLKRRDLRKTGEDLRLACHKAVVVSAVAAVRMAADLTRRAARLQAVAPKLRAKRAGEAVDMFLSHDALSPMALTCLVSDRAARRLCDRLVALGAVREVTGRDTFRLYGL